MNLVKPDCCGNTGCNECRAPGSRWCPAHRDFWRIIGGADVSHQNDTLLELLLHFKQYNYVLSVREVATLRGCEEEDVRGELAALKAAGRVGEWLGGFHVGLNRFGVGVKADVA